MTKATHWGGGGGSTPQTWPGLFPFAAQNRGEPRSTPPRFVPRTHDIEYIPARSKRGGVGSVLGLCGGVEGNKCALIIPHRPVPQLIESSQFSPPRDFFGHFDPTKLLNVRFLLMRRVAV